MFLTFMEGADFENQTAGEYDPDVACVEVIFSIVPKSIGEKDQVIIQCGEDVAICGKSAAGVYSAMFLIPLFETAQITATVALQHEESHTVLDKDGKILFRPE